jgi:hypothetical protein
MSLLIQRYSKCALSLKKIFGPGFAWYSNYFMNSWNKRSSFLTCWGESGEDPQLYEGIHVFSRTKSLLQMARIFHMHQFCFRWCGFLKHTTFLSYGVDFSLAPDFHYMAGTFHMHQFFALQGADFSHAPLFCFTRRGLFTCTNFALDGADFSHALLLVSFTFHIHQISFRRPFFTFSNCPRDGADLENLTDSAN